MSSANPSCFVVGPWRYINLMFIANCLSTEEIRSKVILVFTIFYHLQSYRWSRREISLRAKRMVYHATMPLVWLFGCEKWTVWSAVEKVVAVYSNNHMHRILWVGRRDCIPALESQLIQRWLGWVGDAVSPPEAGLIRFHLLPTPYMAQGGQLITLIFGRLWWRRDWEKITGEFAQDRRAPGEWHHKYK